MKIFANTCAFHALTKLAKRLNLAQAVFKKKILRACYWPSKPLQLTPPSNINDTICSYCCKVGVGSVEQANTQEL
jgi:hypothetical protein